MSSLKRHWLKHALQRLIRYVLITLAFALMSGGLLSWQAIDFSTLTLWPLADTVTPHPLYALVLGLALTPLTVWAPFQLDRRLAQENAGGGKP